MPAILASTDGRLRGEDRYHPELCLKNKKPGNAVSRTGQVRFSVSTLAGRKADQKKSDYSRTPVTSIAPVKVSLGLSAGLDNNSVKRLELSFF